MSDQVAVKGFNLRKILALIALAAAATSAYNAVGYLVYGGISYYSICAIAILFNYRKANLLLWGAVGVHIVLVGYSLWGWQTAQIIPCVYCFGAAGFALLAATVYTRLPVAILPALLIAGVWFAWPHLFYLDNQAGATSQPVVENQYQTENQTGVTANPEPGGDNSGGTQPASTETSSAGEANTGSQGGKDGNNTGETTPVTVTTPVAENTNPDTGQGGTQDPSQDPGAAGNTTPVVNPGSGDTTKPADPPKPPETTTKPADPPKTSP